MWSVSDASKTVADEAVRVLEKHQRRLMPLEDLAKELSVRGEGVSKELKPSEELARELRQDDARRTAMGYRRRFVIDGRCVRLRAEGNRVELDAERWNSKVKKELLAQLKAVHPRAFEQIVANLLTAMGYEKVRLTPYSNDRGIDIEAVSAAGGSLGIPLAVQAKRYDKVRTVTRPEVQKFRGAAVRHPFGMIVTTAKFSEKAREEAARAEEKPIFLIDGDNLVDLMTQHGIGVTSSPLVLLAVDDEGLASPEREVMELADTAEDAASVRSNGADAADHILEKLPGGRNTDYFETILAMTHLALGQPQLHDYVKAFQRRFPSITRADVARRRMRILLSLGLAKIESQRVVLTPLGEELIKTSDPRLLSNAFLVRIAGAEEIRNLARAASDKTELRSNLAENPPAGMSPTQALRVLRWLFQLRIL